MVTRPRVLLAVLALVIFGAAVLGLALAGNGTKAPRPGHAANPVLSAQAARSQAAAWISAQAGRNTIVSCDPVMCAVLLAHGFPAGNLDRLGPDAPDPLASDLIAATAVLRSQFGSRLGSVYAPVILASFGTGSAVVDIRVVAPDGAVVYTSQFRTDQANRQTVGAQFLRNSGIVVDPSARRQLVSGMVDSRLLVTLATMADQVHPLQILTFGGASPGASPGVPLRTAVIFGATSGLNRKQRRAEVAARVLAGAAAAVPAREHPDRSGCGGAERPAHPVCRAQPARTAERKSPRCQDPDPMITRGRHCARRPRNEER